MKANELMIDNWVYNTHNQQPEQVVEICERKVVMAYNDLYDYDEIEPIPLTKGILEKNGFVCTSKESEKEVCYERWSFQDKLFSINIEPDLLFIEVNSGCKNGDAVRYMNFYANSNSIYLHELQNILTLCRIKKEIVP